MSPSPAPASVRSQKLQERLSDLAQLPGSGQRSVPADGLNQEPNKPDRKRALMLKANLRC